jgi:predicted PurR-regulated permease PerM
MEELKLIITIISFIGVIIFILIAWNNDKLIQQLQKDNTSNQDALNQRLLNLEEHWNKRLRDTQNYFTHSNASNNDLIYKKLDNLSTCYSSTESRVSELTSRVWLMEGNVESLQPYIKRIYLKKLAKNAGDIHKNSLKELKEIENELK